MDKETVLQIKRKLNGAYHERQDWPPYALDSIQDRARFNEYIHMLLDEEIETKHLEKRTT